MQFYYERTVHPTVHPVICGADSFKSPKYNGKFQHFAVIIRNVTAEC